MTPFLNEVPTAGRQQDLPTRGHHGRLLPANPHAAPEPRRPAHEHWQHSAAHRHDAGVADRDPRETIGRHGALVIGHPNRLARYQTPASPDPDNSPASGTSDPDTGSQPGLEPSSDAQNPTVSLPCPALPWRAGTPFPLYPHALLHYPRPIHTVVARVPVGFHLRDRTARSAL